MAAPAKFVMKEFATSSGHAVAAHLEETAGMTAKVRRAHTLKKRADSARVQQLRGIFAGYDEDLDGLLSPKYVFDKF